MDNEEAFVEGVEREIHEVTFEPKPGFDLVKYGNVFTFNFNQEFAQRLRNVLADFHKNYKLQEPVAGFFRNLSSCMNSVYGDSLVHGDDGGREAADLYVMERFQHVYTVVCEREFAQNLNQVISQFLVQKRVSPALFSFAKQLEGALYPKRFDPKTRYADEF